MVITAAGKLFSRTFGSRNDRLLRAYQKRVDQINTLEEDIRPLTDTELKSKTEQFREQIKQGKSVGSLLPQIMAVAREAMDRSVGIRNIFNPNANFDASKLPAEVRSIYDRVVRQMQEAEPKEVPGCQEPIPGWMQVEIPNEIYEAVRELYPKSRPPFRARPFDVQLIGGMVLGEGKIAEMKTGEGKTIVAPLACYVACMEELQCSVVTVNDYLVQRDRDWVFPFYYWLGLNVGAIHPFHMQPSEKKQEAYNCDVVYGTNSEFGFDYLRDNMKLSAEEQVQTRRDFCIIDEVDSILIDEARTPLIISGPAHDDAPRYGMADGVARHLIEKQKQWDAANEKVVKAEMRIKGLEGDIRNARDKAKTQQMRDAMKEEEAKLPALEAARDQHTQYYEVEREKKAAHLTHEGVAEAQKVAGIGSFYVGNNMDVPHLLENALRAHAVYTRDKEYVVQNGEVIIVDEFTGRLMVGRQWSDGLHQAVEAKERVKIKEETQTLATVTIQNYFKLYKRLGGMTGTAITEATEFFETYKMDVICVPTNRPVIRNDQNDIIYLSQKDKWNAIIEDIKQMHDIGRPVLVGTTSVENSEGLAQLLAKKHAIKHEVLNAKQHERESHIVEDAGRLGAVMIATNMAGRGTDIKLQPIVREDLVHHWKQRNILPAAADASMSDEEIIEHAWRHMATVNLGIKAKEVAEIPYDELRMSLLRHWVEEEGWRVSWGELSAADKLTMYKFFVAPPWHDKDAIATLSEEQLMDVLDRLPGFMFHRIKIFEHAEELGGLHIIGTERHESRRIDNQLRGRAGRQGDRGSSRFFISLEDDLMQLFAGKTTLTALSKLGMKEGDAIEHRWLTRSVERAQTKVEQRNYEIRKNLLEYDEVMEHQRNAFYGTRQEVLEGEGIDELVLDYLRDTIEDAVYQYLDKQYVATQIAEWVRATLDISIEPGKIHTDDYDDLCNTIRKEGASDLRQNINITLGEYMSHDISPDDWDLRGLASWAMSTYSVDLKQNQLREMNQGEVENLLVDAAIEQLDKKDLSGVQKFLDKLYAQKQLAEWAQTKFELEIDPEEINIERPERVLEDVYGKAQEAYRKREVEYPVEFILDLANASAEQDASWAAAQVSGWAKQRFDMDLPVAEVESKPLVELREKLIEENEKWIHADKLDQLIDETLRKALPPAELAEWASVRLGAKLTEEELAEGDQRELLLKAGRKMLRTELTQLERFVLLQILDMAWKDHLYAMDQLKDSIGLRGYAEKDPRIEYKREGANNFAQMQQVVRDRVTELVFRARLTANVQARSVYGEQQAKHDEAGSLVQAAAQSARQGSNEQQADIDAAERAGGRGDDDDSHLSRKQRRARKAEARQGGGSGGKSRKRRRR